jgi:hypothetical protein
MALARQDVSAVYSRHSEAHCSEYIHFLFVRAGELMLKVRRLVRFLHRCAWVGLLSRLAQLGAIPICVCYVCVTIHSPFFGF